MNHYLALFQIFELLRYVFITLKRMILYFVQNTYFEFSRSAENFQIPNVAPQKY